MWKLHRYYLRELATSATLTFIVLFGVVLLSTVNRGLEKAQGFQLLAAVWVMLFWAADTLPHLIAMSLLFGTVLTFARASQDREITAIRSAGLSPRAAMAPALLLGVAFSLFGAYMQHYTLPWIHFEKHHVVTAEIRNVMVRTGLVDDKMAFGSFVMTWDSQNEDGEWEDVLVKVGEGSSQSDLEPGLWRADRATLGIERERDLLVLRFFGLRQPPAGPKIKEFQTSINLREISEGHRRSESDKDMSSDHLLAEVERGQHDNPNGARFTVHRRSCFAIMPFLFAPIGFCIGVLARDRGRVLALVFAMVPLALYYISDVVSAKLVRVVDWPPVAWLPAVVLTVLGAPFCWRLLRL